MKQENKNKLKKAAKIAGTAALIGSSLIPARRALGIGTGAFKAARVVTPRAAKVAQSVGRSIRVQGQKKPVPVKHWMDYKGPAKIHNGRGNSIGRSGTSYKPGK